MEFLSKAETISALERNIINGKVLPSIICSAKITRKAFRALVENGPEWLLNGAVIVRSSSTSEDNANSSLAGHYSTVGGVEGIKNIWKAIEKVREDLDSENDKLFLQPFIKNTSISGVLFTRDPNSGAPYYIINYDMSPGVTDSVTSGYGTDLETLVISKNHLSFKEGWISRLTELAQELETLFKNDSLDIEFAVDSKNNLYLFQVRPLITSSSPTYTNKQHKNYLDQIHQRFTELAAPHPYLHGRQTIFGTMPDWNPAEIIGTHPRPLQLTMYKELVTDNIWAYQRNNYGYRNLRSFPLLIHFHGLPYIDVRVSFNSFIPASLDEDLAGRLVDLYIDKLKENPQYHDKVEFQIIYSCYSLDFEERARCLLERGFTNEDVNSIGTELLKLTNNIIHPENGLWKNDIEKLYELKRRRDIISNSDLSLIEKTYWLIEDCKRYGTLPFAGLARAGFIAVQLLRSLVEVEIISEKEHDDFFSSIKSVSSDLVTDFSNLTREEFLIQYGHLRPGTYDILSARYDESPDDYFDWTKKEKDIKILNNPAALNLDTLNKLDQALREHGFEHAALSFLNFIKSGIEGREFAKFEFTKNVSLILQLLEQLGKQYGFSRTEMSYFSISKIQDIFSSGCDVPQVIAKSISEGKENYNRTIAIRLPTLITKGEDIFQFHTDKTSPNYITLNDITATLISEDEIMKKKLDKAIILIRNADPGFDWIFSHGISGFVTQYGGANSHMAIRAAELNIPAVIGAGEILFKQLSKAKIVRIDCTNEKIYILK